MRSISAISLCVLFLFPVPVLSELPAHDERFESELPLYPAPFATQVSVVSSSRSSTVLELSISIIDQDRIPFTEVAPVGLVAIQPTGNAEVTVLGVDAALIQNPDEVCTVLPSSVPPAVVRLGMPAIWRDLRIVDLSLAPCWETPAGSVIARGLLVEIRNVGGAGVNEKTRPPCPVSPVWDRMYRRHVLNYDSLNLLRLERGSGKRYLVISRTQFDTQTPQFVEWKTRQGYGVEIVTLEDLGYTDPQDTLAMNATKSYIQNAYTTWPDGVDFVLLVGDMYTDGLPGSIWTREFYSYFYDQGYRPHDQWYAFLEGDDLFADIMLGRFPDSRADRMDYMLAKTVWYEKEPYIEGTWQKNALMTLMSDSSFPELLDTKEYVSGLLDDWGMNVTQLFDDEATPSQIIPVINHGLTFYNYLSEYTSANNWAGTFDINDVAAVNNARKPGVWIIPGESVAAFDYLYTTLAEALLRHDYTEPSEPKGAVALIGSQAYSYPTFDVFVDKGIYLGFVDQGCTSLGEAFLSGMTYAHYNVLQDPPTLRDSMMREYTILGDPSLQIWTDVPIGSMVSTVPDTVPMGPTTDITVEVRTTGHQPVDGALVCLRKTGDVYVYGYTDPSGLINLPVTPMTEGNIDLTVTAYNVKPHFDVIPVVLAPIPSSPENVSAQASAEDLLLTWSPVTEDMLGNPITVDSYGVYRAEVAHFLLGDLDPVADISDTSFLDLGAVGDTTVNYYYRIVATSPSQGSSPPSLPVGEIDFSTVR